jgi:hypothetical protein
MSDTPMRAVDVLNNVNYWFFMFAPPGSEITFHGVGDGLHFTYSDDTIVFTAYVSEDGTEVDSEITPVIGDPVTAPDVASYGNGGGEGTYMGSDGWGSAFNAWSTWGGGGGGRPTVTVHEAEWIQFV